MGELIDTGRCGYPASEHSCNRELPSAATIRASHKRRHRGRLQHIDPGAKFRCSCGTTYTYRVSFYIDFYFHEWRKGDALTGIATSRCCGTTDQIAISSEL